MGLSVAALASLAWAQAPKGNAASGKSAGKPAALDEEPRAEERKKPAAVEELVPVALPDPAVDAILQTKPSTAVELARAAKALADLNRPDLARQYLKKLIEANLDSKALSALSDEFGPAMFANLGSRRELAPEGKQVADAVLDAKIHQLQDPQRVAGLIQRLGDPSPEIRGQAVVGLQGAGAAAVGPLLSVLADPQRAAEHASVRAALVAVGPEAVGPLMGMLDASDPKIVAEAIAAIANLRAITPSYFVLRACCDEKGNAEVRTAARAAAKRIWKCVPSRQEAASLLADLSRRYAKRVEPLPEAPSGRVVIWSWDDAKKQAVAKSYQPDAAARHVAARLARDAYAVVPESREMLLLHLTTMLQEAAYDHGLDHPLTADKDSPAGKVQALGPDTLEDVLRFAMQEGQIAAATASARLLGQSVGAEALLRRAAQPCPLVVAVRHPDQRLRLAAVEAVMRLRPREPYAGASNVGEAVAFLAASHGTRRVLVGSPRTDEARRLAGLLAKLGYVTDSAATGRDLLRKALQSPDYELILVEAIVSCPTVDELVQSLRRDGRTAQVPVGVLAAAGDLDRAKHMVRRDAKSEAFPRPHDVATLRLQIDDLVARAGDRANAAERRLHAAMALDWLIQLSAEPQCLYDLSRDEGVLLAALAVPGLTAKACAALGNLGTPGAQQALVDLASGKASPLADRKAAVEGFRTAVQRRGLLLTIPKIQLQYDRYNQSAREDRKTQAVLGMILDCIEAPAKLQKQLAGSRTEDETPQVANAANSE